MPSRALRCLSGNDSVRWAWWIEARVGLGSARRLRSANRLMRTTLFVEIVLPVPVVDLAAGRNPDLLARFYVGQRPIEVFAAVRMPDQERMQADRHDPPGLGAVFIQHVELIADHLAERLRGLTLVEEHGNVVQLD